MTILLTGANGQVGWALRQTLAPLGEVVATTRETLDLTDEGAIRAMVRAVAPRWIVNAAAYTAVDAAESDEAAAFWLNAEVPRILAEEASRCGGWLVHYSTDYVFDGMATAPYRESDPVHPLGVYGHSKAAGEVAVRGACDRYLIFRIAWVYGRRGKNFFRTMERLLSGPGPVRVVADQLGTPTWSQAVAEATAAILLRVQASATENPTENATLTGTYHLAGAGHCSWHGFAESIARGLALPADRTVTPITTADYPTPARRPAFSVLNASLAARTFGVQLPPWEAQLARCLDSVAV